MTLELLTNHFCVALRQHKSIVDHWERPPRWGGCPWRVWSVARTSIFNQRKSAKLPKHSSPPAICVLTIKPKPSACHEVQRGPSSIANTRTPDSPPPLSEKY